MEIWTRRLMELFLESRETYRDISNATKIPVSAVHRYITGETENIPLDRLEKLAAHFGVKTEYLTGWETDQGDNDLNGLREQLRRQPGMRILFDAAKNANEEDLIKFARMIEAFRDGDNHRQGS